MSTRTEVAVNPDRHPATEHLSSPFLEGETLADTAELDPTGPAASAWWSPRAAALIAASPFDHALERGTSWPPTVDGPSAGAPTSEATDEPAAVSDAEHPAPGGTDPTDRDDELTGEAIEEDSAGEAADAPTPTPTRTSDSSRKSSPRR